MVNYYMSLELMIVLAQMNTLCCGTVNSFRVGLKGMKKSCAALKKMKRGESMLLLLFAFQSMFISIWVSRLEIAEFPDSVRRSAP